QISIEPIDPLEIELRDLDRRHRALAHERGKLSGAEKGEIGAIGGHEDGRSPRPGTGSTRSSGSSASGPSASISALSRVVTSARSSDVTGNPRAAASAPTCSVV